jgi:hypothetical protein
VPSIWRGDYESGDLRQWADVQASRTNPAYPVGSVGDGSVELVRSPLREGRYAARFVASGTAHSSAGTDRAEVGATIAETGAREGSDRWYAWSTYWPAAGNSAGFSRTSGDFNVFTQWHSTDGDCGDNLQLGVDATSTPNTNELYSDLNNHPGGDCDDAERLRHARLAKLVFDRWYDFIVHVHWSARPRIGYYEIWLNGRQVVRRTYGATMWDASGAYWKQGFYRDAFPATNTVVQDGAVSSAGLAAAAAAFRLRFRDAPETSPDGTMVIDAASFAGARVAIRVRSSSGRVVGRAHGTADGNGNLRARLRLSRGAPAHALRVLLSARVDHRLPSFTRRAEEAIR